MKSNKGVWSLYLRWDFVFVLRLEELGRHPLLTAEQTPGRIQCTGTLSVPICRGGYRPTLFKTISQRTELSITI